MFGVEKARKLLINRADSQKSAARCVGQPHGTEASPPERTHHR